MTIKVKWKFFCYVFISLDLVQCISLDDKSPSKDFIEFSVTKPRIYHGRSKREISNTVESEGMGGHVQDLVVSLDLEGVDTVLELTLNHDLITESYFQKTQENGSHRIHRPKPEELELCHYRGFISNVPGSWAAISTCSGFKGVVFDGKKTYFIDEGPNEGSSYVYNEKSLRPDRNQSCGLRQSTPVGRVKRDADEIRGPYNANRRSRYVELLLVVDNEEYKKLGDIKTVFQHCKDLANIINALFVPLNVFIALIGVVVWTEKDEIVLSNNGDTTLANFLNYRREILAMEHPNDNAQLLTRIRFEGGVVGKALKGPMCTFQYSGGVFMDHSDVVGLVATTVAHELGHNFGMEHDTSDCQCPEDRCIMAPSLSSIAPSHWSSCSLEFLALAFEHGIDYCLRNKPKKLFDSPVCGNGFVEPGEQCDCGLPHRCDNPCCNGTTCMLHSNASCATGECCDFQTCKPKNAGTVCRTAEHECDLPEYCTGESEYCPGDVFKMDGEACNRGKAFCYQGMCRTHSDQCRLLWGPSGKNSDIQCYEMNVQGTKYGNCGYVHLNKSYIKCVNENVFCGMMHCSHYNERLEFGVENVSIQSHSFINKKGDIIACRTAIVDLGLDEIDPGLVPDGAKCGEGKMCVNQKCMSVGELRKMSPNSCPEDCNGNGVCNSKGHCHCVKGFAPPLCDYPGTGGSTDSGPASDPNLRREFTIALYVIFLCVVPLIALAFIFIYYTKQNSRIWWKKSPTRLENAQWECKRRSPTRGTAILLPESVGVIDVGIIQTSRSPGVKITSVNENAPAQPKSLQDLQNNLFGKGKGFAIKPLKKINNIIQEQELSKTGSSSPTRYENVPSEAVEESAPATVKLPCRQNSWKSEEGRLRIISPPTLPNDTNFKNANVSYSKKPKVEQQEVNKAEEVDAGSVVPPPERPEISEPVLNGTTAKDLISVGTVLVPTRKAPGVPETNNPPCVTEKYTKEPPPVPVQESQKPESPPFEDKKLPKEPKEYPTLTKLANIMKTSISRSSSVNEKTKAKVKIDPKKIKFDREKLKNIEISNPIPQVEAAEDQAKETDIARTQSMREPNRVKPNIQSFGSMRAGGGKRPTSIHVPNRPTSPPPRPPPPPSSTDNQEYAYDDCLNLLSEKTAPLAHIEEESTPSPNNIYAVIEESPKLESERKVHFRPDLPPETKKGLDAASPPSGSTESMGLLSEIVNEIQARNLESIYSSGTLKKNKKSEKNSDVYNSGARSDVSSASSGNGYLNPKKINSPSSESDPKPESASSIRPSSIRTPPAFTPRGKPKTDSRPETKRSSGSKANETPSNKTEISDSKPPSRPLPAPPVKNPVKSESSVAGRPLPAIPKNLDKKPPTEKKPEFVRKKNSNVAQLQSRFEGKNVTNGGAASRKPATESTAAKPTDSVPPKS